MIEIKAWFGWRGTSFSEAREFIKYMLWETENATKQDMEKALDYMQGKHLRGISTLELLKGDPDIIYQFRNWRNVEILKDEE